MDEISSCAGLLLYALKDMGIVLMEKIAVAFFQKN